MARPSPSQVDEGPALRWPFASFPLGYPELTPVLSRAMSAVIEALELNEQTPRGLILELEQVASRAMTEAYQPVAEAASRLAQSTETSRTAEAASVQKKAEETAALVAETTATLRHRHDRLAERVAQDATAAAREAAGSSVPGHKLEAKKHAIREANAVRVAAVVRADQRAAAAALTAAAAAHAEVRLAVEAAHAAVVVEHDALQAAAAIQAAALEIMYEIAIDAACRQYVAPIPLPDNPPDPNPKERQP